MPVVDGLLLKDPGVSPARGFANFTRKKKQNPDPLPLGVWIPSGFARLPKL